MRQMSRALIVVMCSLLAHSPSTILGGDPPPPLVPTTLEDFFLPGTQPDPDAIELAPVEPASPLCQLCHGFFDPQYDQPHEAEPYRNWAGSMMAQASRDPIFYACLTIANQDAGESGDFCIRCHAPGAWLGGRSTPTDGSGLTKLVDFDGVTCHFCHRLVDPVLDAESPLEDVPIIIDLLNAGLLPTDAGSAQYVVDPGDVRRGPFPDDDWPYNPHGDAVDIIVSPFHRQSDLCGTCHDVSNPAFSRQEDGSYVPNDLGEPHPTMNKADMFPVERTFSEWSQSQFADGGVQLEGRFGGNHPTGVMETCQDCHMPDRVGPGCNLAEDFPIHNDMPQHAFNGGNTWVLNAVRTLYDDWDTGLTDEITNDAHTRVLQMLQNASDMDLIVEENTLRVRITNYAGHKLPTGYPEGRRAWLNVRFFDEEEQLVGEHGAYDFETAALTTADTKVYEMKLGLDQTMADLTGLPVGESFHFAINNMIVKDNRIPPIGFTNAGFESVQAGPVDYVYADGQHWDDTEYAIPESATEVTVTFYYQTTSREYIEFLRDENVTDDRGQIAYDQWVLHGKSAPAIMDQLTLNLIGPPADLDGDGDVDAADLAILLGAWGTCPDPLDCPADLDGDGSVSASDLAMLLGSWG
jgi:hypothetical protein